MHRSGSFAGLPPVFLHETSEPSNRKGYVFTNFCFGKSNYFRLEPQRAHSFRVRRLEEGLHNYHCDACWKKLGDIIHKVILYQLIIKMKFLPQEGFMFSQIYVLGNQIINFDRNYFDISINKNIVICGLIRFVSMCIFT